jgi:hypothetical protein
MVTSIPLLMNLKHRGEKEKQTRRYLVQEVLRARRQLCAIKTPEPEPDPCT